MAGELIKEAPECMNDVMKNIQEELVEVNLSVGGKERMVKISKGLLEEKKRRLIALLKEYKDVFAWVYEEMPRLDPQVVTYKLNVNPKAKLVKQPARKYHLDVEEKIKAEVSKLLKAGFLEEIKYPEWLANIVPTKKKGGQIRICVDFRDLNRHALKMSSH